jgi:hypothetical protein
LGAIILRRYVFGAGITALVAFSLLTVGLESAAADDIKPSFVEGKNVKSAIDLINPMGATTYEKVATEFVHVLADVVDLTRARAIFNPNDPN